MAQVYGARWRPQRQRGRRGWYSALLLWCIACTQSPEERQEQWVRSAFAGVTESVVRGVMPPSVGDGVSGWRSDSVLLVDELAPALMFLDVNTLTGRTIGRRGNGPGEFAGAVVAVPASSYIWVADVARQSLLALSPIGTELARRPLAGFLLHAGLWHADTLAVVTYSPALGASSVSIRLHALEGGSISVDSVATPTAVGASRCDRETGTRSPQELPFVAAAGRSILVLDPFTLGGRIVLADGAVRTIQPLCPPLAPMSGESLARYLQAIEFAGKDQPASVRAGLAQAGRAYAQLLQPVATASRAVVSPRGEWFLPLDIGERFGVLLRLDGEAWRPAFGTRKGRITASGWSVCSAGSSAEEGFVLVRADDEASVHTIARQPCGETVVAF